MILNVPSRDSFEALSGQNSQRAYRLVKMQTTAVASDGESRRVRRTQNVKGKRIRKV